MPLSPKVGPPAPAPAPAPPAPLAAPVPLAAASAVAQPARPFCIRFGGALALPLVMAGVVVTCVIAALLIKAAGAIPASSHLRPNAHDEIYAFSLVCDFLTLWLLVAPVFAYLHGGQVRKLIAIRGFYSVPLIIEYFDQFWSGRPQIAELIQGWRTSPEDPGLAKKIDEKFHTIIVEDFGGGVYIIPMVILLATGFIVLFLAFAGGIAYAEQLLKPGVTPPVMPHELRLDLVNVAAIFGAYTWIASDSITREHQWTFHPADLSWYALRLAIAVPLGQAIAAAAGTASADHPGKGAFLAFVVTLSGVDEATADALRAEGVSTIAQVTAVDPVRISILTGLPFEYVLALIDSAILWTFFRDDTDKLRAYGLRGASGLLLHAETPPEAELAIAGAMLATATETLRQRQQDMDAATAARNAALAAAGANPDLAPQGQASQAALNTATNARDDAARAVNTAATTLRAAAARDALFAAIQADLKINALGLAQAVAQLRTDAYARFIRHLLGR